MRPLKTQYFLCFAAIGSLLPSMPVVLSDRGFTSTQIGYIMAASSVAVIVTPVIIALLADTRMDPRRLMGIIFVASAVPLLLMTQTTAFWPVILLFALHSLAFKPANSLQDAMAFTARRRQALAGEPVKPFHRIRVWGTIGFILPSVILFYVLRLKGVSTDAVLYTAAAFCALGFLNTWRLPVECSRSPDATTPSRLPTIAAARAMLHKDLLALCAATFLSQLVAMLYYGFYPVYLRKAVIVPDALLHAMGSTPGQPGIPAGWLMLITNIGVVGEVVYMLMLGRLERRLGVKGLIIAGITAGMIRLTLLACSTSLYVAAGGQLLHGLMVLGVNIMPIMYIDRRAGDAFRNSMQGVFSMAILGVSQVVGYLLGGWISHHFEPHGIRAVFLSGAMISVVAIAIVAFFFKEKHGHAAAA